MKNWIIRWVASALALYIITQIHIGITVNSPGTALIAVVALGLANALIRPIILFFTWPINCLTFGLLGFVINVVLFRIVGSGLLPGFQVADMKAALIGSVLMGVLSGLISFALKDRGEKKRG